MRPQRQLLKHVSGNEVAKQYTKKCGEERRQEKKKRRRDKHVRSDFRPVFLLSRAHMKPMVPSSMADESESAMPPVRPWRPLLKHANPATKGKAPKRAKVAGGCRGRDHVHQHRVGTKNTLGKGEALVEESREDGDHEGGVFGDHGRRLLQVQPLLHRQGQLRVVSALLRVL